MDAVAPSATDLLSRLRAVPEDEIPGRIWDLVPPAGRRHLFDLLAVAADLPRLSTARVLDRADARKAWPDLVRSLADVRRLQAIVDRPTLPGDAIESTVADPSDLDAARQELEATHCVTIEGILTAAQRGRVDARIEAARREKPGIWKPMEPDEEPELWEVFGEALAGPVFRGLTGWDPERDEFSLTLSLQDLDSTGIGWHRDLYWPREWVGEDVFAVLYGLGSDSPEKGGAFAYWVPWSEELRYVHRQDHQATVLWNAADDAGRILHAVTGYHGDDTRRHLVILQCLRRSRSRVEAAGSA